MRDGSHLDLQLHHVATCRCAHEALLLATNTRETENGPENYHPWATLVYTNGRVSHRLNVDESVQYIYPPRHHSIGSKSELCIYCGI